MDGDSANLFINTIVKNIQMLCHGHLSFNQNVEVIGHLYLNIDSDKKLNYIVNEKCIKVNASTTFTSNSFHAEPGNMVQSEQNKYTKAIGGPTPKNVQNKSRKQKSTPIKPEKSPKLIKLSESFEDSETPIDCNIDNSLGVTFSQDTISENPLDLPSLTPDTSIVKTEAEEADEDFYHIEENENDNDTSLDGGGTNDMLYSSSSLPTLPILPTHSPSGSQQYSSAAVDDNQDITPVRVGILENIRLLKSIADQQVPESEVEYTIVEMGTRQGRPLLVDSIGYSYTIRKKTDACIRWWCSLRSKALRCPASVAQRGDSFRRGALEHIHNAKPGLLTATLVMAEARNQALNDFDTPSSEVVERAMSVSGMEEDESCLPKESSLKRMINRHRQILRGKIDFVE